MIIVAMLSTLCSHSQRCNDENQRNDTLLSIFRRDVPEQTEVINNRALEHLPAEMPSSSVAMPIASVYHGRDDDVKSAWHAAKQLPRY